MIIAKRTGKKKGFEKPTGNISGSMLCGLGFRITKRKLQRTRKKWT